MIALLIVVLNVVLTLNCFGVVLNVIPVITEIQIFAKTADTNIVRGIKF